MWNICDIIIYDFNSRIKTAKEGNMLVCLILKNQKIFFILKEINI